jgi:hypothetical protein
VKRSTVGGEPTNENAALGFGKALSRGSLKDGFAAAPIRVATQRPKGVASFRVPSQQPDQRRHPQRLKREMQRPSVQRDDEPLSSHPKGGFTRCQSVLCS